MDTTPLPRIASPRSLVLASGHCTSTSPTSRQYSQPSTIDMLKMCDRPSNRRRMLGPLLRWKNSPANLSNGYWMRTQKLRICTKLFPPPFRRARSASGARYITPLGEYFHAPTKRGTAPTKRNECFSSFLAWWNRSCTARPTPMRTPPSRRMVPEPRLFAPSWGM